MNIISKPSVTDTRKAFYPELSGDSNVRMDNSLGQSSQTLWQTVSKEYIDTTTKLLAPLTHLTHDLGADATACTQPGVTPIVHVELVEGAGTALKDTTNWEQTALSNRYAPVALHRYSRPFALSVNDLRNGERIETKIGAAINAVGEALLADWAGTIAAAMPTITGADVAPVAEATGKVGIKYVPSAATITPEYVAETLSALFGERGMMDELVLTPTAISKLIPVNALSLNFAVEGTYGIRHIESSALLPGADGANSALGVALRRDGVVMAAGLPDLSALQAAGGVALRSLGSIAGVPILLKAWTKPGQELIYNSVEAFAGFAIGNPADVYVLSSATTGA